jgi:hypothetical protein
LQQGHARLTAFAAKVTGDKKLSQRAWQEFNRGQSGTREPVGHAVRIQAPDVLNPLGEAPHISTNGVAQWSLAAMQCLAFAGEGIGE